MTSVNPLFSGASCSELVFFVPKETSCEHEQNVYGLCSKQEDPDRNSFGIDRNFVLN